jgi:hypothetical protein
MGEGPLGLLERVYSLRWCELTHVDDSFGGFFKTESTNEMEGEFEAVFSLGRRVEHTICWAASSTVRIPRVGSVTARCVLRPWCLVAGPCGASSPGRSSRSASRAPQLRQGVPLCVASPRSAADACATPNYIARQ